MKKFIVSLLALSLLFGSTVIVYGAPANENEERVLTAEEAYKSEDVTILNGNEPATSVQKDNVIAESYGEDDGGTYGNLTWRYTESTGELVISGKGEMIESEGWNYPWGEYAEEARKIIITSGVTSIAEGAFCFSAEVKSVTLSDTLKSIGASAFGCEKLSSIVIPDNLQEVGIRWLESDYLSDISVSSKNKYFSSVDGVLFNYDKTELILYPTQKHNKSYTIPETVQTVREYSLEYCDYLEILNIPKNVSSFSANCVYGCHLREINVDQSNKYFTSKSGVLFDKQKETIIAYPENKAGATYTTPMTVKTIGESAFDGAYNLEDIKLTGNISSIGFGAFSGSAIKTITIPASVTQIGDRAFGHEVTILNNTYKYYVKLTDVYYTGTEQQWSEIEKGEFVENALASVTIHYSSPEVIPEDEGGDEPTPGPVPDPKDLAWESTFTFSNGDELVVEANHTTSTEYDGRKHVVSIVNGKESKASASVNPDIEFSDFRVTVNDEEISGITIKSFSYKNNIYPIGDDESTYMQIIPSLSYNMKDSGLKALLAKHTDFKTVLNKMGQSFFLCDSSAADPTA